MRRSTCVVEPAVCPAGMVGTFRFIYTPATSLPKGTKLLFDLGSKNRSIDWELPNADSKAKKNRIWMTTSDGKEVYGKLLPSSKKGLFSSQFEFLLPSEVKAGSSLTLHMGSPNKNPADGTKAQTFVQRRRSFNLIVEPKEKGSSREEEVFHLDIRGGDLSRIRILAPSLVARNRRFDVVVRFEDLFGNLTSNAIEGTLVELSYENLRENLNWKLFVPETGFINLPNLYFNEVGVYKIQLHNLKSGEKFFSHPIKCLQESPLSLFWGLLHGESEKYDTTDNIESCLRHLRDEKGLQFFASSPFESVEETPNDTWKIISEQLQNCNKDERLTTLLGFQYQGDKPGEGLRQVIYFKDNKALLRKKDPKTGSLEKLYKSLSPKEALCIPLFSMAKGVESDFSHFDPELEKVVEIYNAWGSSESSAKEGNTRPILSKDKTGFQESETGSIIKALRKNCRFGFVAGGFDDRGTFSSLYNSSQVQYSPGLTAILAPDHSRDSLIGALTTRACYATTGAKIIIGFTLAGAPMGSETSTKTKPGLAFNRHIVGYIAGTAPLKEVIIMRNGLPWKTLTSSTYFLDFAIDDSDPLSSVSLAGEGEKPPFAFYFVKVIQQDGEIAWGSPIWVDSDQEIKVEASKKRKKG